MLDCVGELEIEFNDRSMFCQDNGRMNLGVAGEKCFNGTLRIDRLMMDDLIFHCWENLCSLKPRQILMLEKMELPPGDQRQHTKKKQTNLNLLLLERLSCFFCFILDDLWRDLASLIELGEFLPQFCTKQSFKLLSKNFSLQFWISLD